MREMLGAECKNSIPMLPLISMIWLPRYCLGDDEPVQDRVATSTHRIDLFKNTDFTL